MMEAALTERADIPAGASPIDLADLVSVLVSIRAPSRDVDCVVEAMLGGSRPVAEVAPAAVRAGRWLAGEVPAYTAGGSALSVLARRRGYRIRCEREGLGYRAETVDPSTGRTASAAASTEGGAGLAAIAQLASHEVRA